MLLSQYFCWHHDTGLVATGYGIGGRHQCHDSFTTADIPPILLVDDEALLRRGLRALLDEQPDMHVVAEASDGREAIARARETEPDVVLMDVSMPGMNGAEATRRIARKLPGVKVLCP